MPIRLLLKTSGAEFFETFGRNLLAAEAAAGVQHHVALSIVGTDRTPDNGYFRAKVAQEKLIEASGIPYTIIRSTQFFEFLGGIAASSADGNWSGFARPLPAHRGGRRRGHRRRCGTRGAANGIVEIAGPERAPFNEFIARYLKAVGDPREVVGDPRPAIPAAGSRSSRSCRWAKRASAASVSTNGSAAPRQEPDPHWPNEGPKAGEPLGAHGEERGVGRQKDRRRG